MNTETSPQRGAIEPWVKELLAQVKSLRFGVVQIVVHDARVVQIERTEKFRFDAANTGKKTTHQTTGGFTI